MSVLDDRVLFMFYSNIFQFKPLPCQYIFRTVKSNTFYIYAMYLILVDSCTVEDLEDEGHHCRTTQAFKRV